MDLFFLGQTTLVHIRLNQRNSAASRREPNGHWRIFCQNWPLRGTKSKSDLSPKLYAYLTPCDGALCSGAEPVQVGSTVFGAEYVDEQASQFPYYDANAVWSQMN
jgi:hypothetical protein